MNFSQGASSLLSASVFATYGKQRGNGFCMLGSSDHGGSEWYKAGGIGEARGALGCVRSHVQEQRRFLCDSGCVRASTYRAGRWNIDVTEMSMSNDNGWISLYSLYSSRCSPRRISTEGTQTLDRPS